MKLVKKKVREVPFVIISSKYCRDSEQEIYNAVKIVKRYASAKSLIMEIDR